MIWLNAFNLPWYQSEFVKLNVYGNFEPSRVLYQTQNLFGYLDSQNDLQETYYTEREIAHLADIKNILLAVKIITAAILAVLILTWFLVWRTREYERVIKIIFWSSAAGFIGYLLAGAFLFFFFERFFILFHQVLFRNDFWLLDPAKESLIMIFPPQLFADLGGRILIGSLIVSGIMFIVSGLYLLRRKN